MPGWYIHMEAARSTVEKMRAGQTVGLTGITPEQAVEYGEIAYTWRNYLAIGAVGPDMFYLLPDFGAPVGNALLSIADWTIREWEVIDEAFVGPWEDAMGAVLANDADLTSMMTGGLSTQLGEGLGLAVATLRDALESLLTRLNDWFGHLSNAPSQGVSDSRFFWADMLHYRRTGEFATALWAHALEHHRGARARIAEAAAAGREPTPEEQAALGDAETEIAFALGWTTHVAVDTVGHSFTNAKCGGPYRLHPQRHHMLENHFDACVYKAAHDGDGLYGSLNMSALHLRIAFTSRDEAPYEGRDDAPMYDYFQGLPAYDTDPTSAAGYRRREFFDADPGQLPPHLVDLLRAVMEEIFGDDPKILTDAPSYAEDGTGRPNAEALQIMWEVTFRYMRMSASGGLNVQRPQPPTVFTSKPFPTAPGVGLPDEDDPEGGDGESSRGWSWKHLRDVVLAVLAHVNYARQVVTWAVAVLPSYLMDIATYPVRELLYYGVLSPLYSTYLAARKLLVLEGFAWPDSDELESGLATLGGSVTFGDGQLSDDLADLFGYAPAVRQESLELSGRDDPAVALGRDLAYPRQSPRDPVPELNQILGPAGISVPLGSTLRLSEWTVPWRYPDRTITGRKVGWEAPRTHAGPWMVGDDATVLFVPCPTDEDAAQAFDVAPGPGHTKEACVTYFPQGRHLGDVVSFSLRQVCRAAGGVPLTNYNLDSDRGYAQHCWDWQRMANGDQADPGHQDDFTVHVPPGQPPDTKFDFMQPATAPEAFDLGWLTPDQATGDRLEVSDYWRRTDVPVLTYYRDAAAPEPMHTVQELLDMPTVSDDECRSVGMRPDGTEV